ncbi:hypothetical protein HJC23_004440 [Cyclotella cryptica]|uniref:CAP-Gly domain-containing protein n=1 Tax=Cyclotella cryptica TaxID=29204 RepID=A0ABD3QFZ6_9STRA
MASSPSSSSSSNNDLPLFTPVHVTSSSSSSSSSTANSNSSSNNNDDEKLEGIIAHLGPVQFAPGTDWIGIRLTGSSLGRGKNDGTVRDVFYFDAGGDKNGMFVRRCHVTKRNLSRLESLRLKREIGEIKTASSMTGGGGGGGGSSVSVGSSTSSSKGSGKNSNNPLSPVKPRTAAVTAPSSIESAKKTTDEQESHAERMERLRARREALAKERGKIPTTPASDKDFTAEKRHGTEHESTNPTTTATTTTETEPTQPNLTHATPGYKAELHRLQSVISTLQHQLQQKETEVASLQSSLDFMSAGAERSTHDAVRMYALGALALTEAKIGSPRGVKGGAGGGGGGGGERRSLMGDMEQEGEKGEDEEEEEGSSDDDDDDEEEEEQEDKNEQVVHQAAAAVSKALVERNNELMAQLSDMASMKTNFEHQLSEAEERISNLQHKLEQSRENYQNEKRARVEEQQGHSAEKSVLTSQLTSLEREYQILQERVSDKSSTQDHSHVTLAKLRAELTSLQRKNDELNNEKMDLETTLEELVLDKEQLKEENEVLTDQLEEVKIDLESAQLELEDVKSQLASVESGGAATLVEADAVEKGAGETSSAAVVDSQDVVRSLTVQNTRLRTAILRLREQTELEKNELQRQLKVLQSDSSSREELQSELETLKAVHATTVKEVQELKDIVDQTTSLEETIETLSDKVWSLEQRNADLERTIRELEESAEIAAEMEEVQSDELKMVMRDLEGKNALIRNLEEAIRMQRRREEDFQRYVSDFRTSISTLKQEKAALLALTEGEQGEKSHLMATSQKALAQAAQLAADAALARKRDAEAAFDRIMARSATYLCQRLETLLPSGVVSAELAAVKGEMHLGRVADKAAVSLSTLEEVFNRAIEKGVSGLSEFNILGEDNAVLSDGSTQQIATMIHQSEFARTVIEAASDALRFMAAGQWPELLSQELSTDLGSVVVHSISHLDLALSEQLRLLKQEGVLSPLRSSLSDLDQSVRNTRLALFSASDESGKSVIPPDWNPPGLEALKSLSLGRFSCLGATAIMASAISPLENAENEPPAPTLPNLARVLERAKQSCSNVTDVCRKLSGLGLNDMETIEALNELSSKYRAISSALFDAVKEAFTQKSISSDDLDKCSNHLEEVVTLVRQLSAVLRKAHLSEQDSSRFHELSPEFGDAWGGVTKVVSEVRSVDGDPEDINYLMRARAIEQQLSDAVQNEPKLVIANAKIASLEKSLASRSKEIAMQNSRISELESLITKSSSSMMSPVKGGMPPGSPSPADTSKLREEVRVLQEALDVMQQQADEYEKEIRALKDKSRTPRVSRQASGRLTPKKSSAVDIEATLSQFGQGSGAKSGGVSSRDLLLESISLEAALFRPALASATQSASYWKARSMGSALSKLAPLNVQKSRNVSNLEAVGVCDSDGYIGKSRLVEEVTLARNEVRLSKASFSIVDLSEADISSRRQLFEQKQKVRVAERRLHDATLSLVSQQSMEKRGTQSFAAYPSINNKDMWGKIIVPCKDDTGFVAPLEVTKYELQSFHSFLVK